MDIFQFRGWLIGDYEVYIHSFIQRARLREYVSHGLRDRLLWPNPLIQGNPALEPDDSIDDLVHQAVLH